MDLIGIANDLKGMSDQQLAQAMRDPAVPPYLVVSEMNSRNQMRNSYVQKQQQPPQSNVAQRVMGQFAQNMQQRPPMAPQQGIMGGMPQPQQPNQAMGAFGRPQQPPAMQPAPLRGGGIVGLGIGGDVPSGDDAPDWSSIVPSEASLAGLPQSVEDYRKIYKAPDPADAARVVDTIRGVSHTDYLSPFAQKVAELEAQMRNQKPGNNLLTLGLGIAASHSPTVAGAIGEGGLNALQRYDQQKQAQQTQQMQLLGLQGDVARAQQQREEQLIHNALGVWEKQLSNQNVMESEIGANVRARLNAVQSGKLKVADLQERYREAMAKLNEPEMPDTPVKLTWIMHSDPSPERRQAAKEALTSLTAHEAAIAAAKKSNQDFTNPGSPKIPTGWASTPDGRVIPGGGN